MPVGSIITQLHAAGVEFQIRGAKVFFKPLANMPAGLLGVLQARRDEAQSKIAALFSPRWTGVPFSMRPGVDLLIMCQHKPHAFPGSVWTQLVIDTERSLNQGMIAKATACGWSANDLFGVAPESPTMGLKVPVFFCCSTGARSST